MEIRLSAFADEASADLLRQIETLHRERIPLIELRGVNGKNVAELEDEEALRCREQLDAGGIAVWSIGSPLGKIGVREAGISFGKYFCYDTRACLFLLYGRART